MSQLRRYEAGTSQPTLDVRRKLAIALRVSADLLVFDKEERGPDADLRLQFEAVSRLDRDEKKVVKSSSRASSSSTTPNAGSRQNDAGDRTIHRVIV